MAQTWIIENTTIKGCKDIENLLESIYPPLSYYDCKGPPLHKFLERDKMSYWYCDKYPLNTVQFLVHKRNKKATFTFCLAYKVCPATKIILDPSSRGVRFQ